MLNQNKKLPTPIQNIEDLYADGRRQFKDLKKDEINILTALLINESLLQRHRYDPWEYLSPNEKVTDIPAALMYYLLTGKSEIFLETIRKRAIEVAKPIIEDYFENSSYLESLREF